METPDLPKKSSEETTLLHMGKFAPGQPIPNTAPEEGMTMFIKRAAAETVRDSKAPIIVPKHAQGLQAEEMLGAVSYAYAKDVYESERIEKKMLKDSEMSEKLGENVPDAKSISRFRKLNRGAIMATLEKAFRLKRRKDKEEMAKPLPGQPVTARPVPSTADDGENTVMISKKQAEQKIENAIIIDGLSKES
jgi:hypothetical protein